MVVVIGLAQQAHGKPTKVCGVPVSSLSLCLPSVKQPNPPSPSPQCCDVLKPIAQDTEKCLCSYATSPLLGRFGIDKGLFLALPKKCGLPDCPPN
uniref:Bifunctional inhibitor/plant lipid transfer protein/seed storage helical domain-containing protein n=1 Tax=Chenopodium quinoa TaxID=63459 RepID=A0A803L8D6_CHEQI